MEVLAKCVSKWPHMSRWGCTSVAWKDLRLVTREEIDIPGDVAVKASIIPQACAEVIKEENTEVDLWQGCELA
jgi:hypothetical protein